VAELDLRMPHVVQLEAQMPDAKGRGGVTIRDLFRATLSMRPDRILVGECRGGEALDMIQAMNSGHAGSLSTVHADDPMRALSRLETLCLMSGHRRAARGGAAPDHRGDRPGRAGRAA
jgi:pilus assembly protein CpaF